MAFVVQRRPAVAPPHQIAYRDPIMGRTGVRRRGMGESYGAAIGAGATTGAAVGSIVPILGTGIGAAVGTLVGGVSTLFGGGGTPDQMKAIWSVVPFSVLRISGGHGTWTDTLTHEVLTDAQSDLRKSAVVASAIGAFNDARNWWYDQATQQYLSGASALQRWQQKFGNLSFANAYASYPGAFQIYSPVSSSGDPQIHSPNTSVLQTPVAGTVPLVAPPLTSNLTPQQIATMTPQQQAIYANQANSLQQASLLGGGMSTGTLLLVGGGLLVGLLLMNRRGGSPEAS